MASHLLTRTATPMLVPPMSGVVQEEGEHAPGHSLLVYLLGLWHGSQSVGMDVHMLLLGTGKTEPLGWYKGCQGISRQQEVESTG